MNLSLKLNYNLPLVFYSYVKRWGGGRAARRVEMISARRFWWAKLKERKHKEDRGVY